MKTVNDLIIELQSLKPSLRNKPAIVIAPNGIEFEACIKIGFPNNPIDLNSPKNVVITYE